MKSWIEIRKAETVITNTLGQTRTNSEGVVLN